METYNLWIEVPTVDHKYLGTVVADSLEAAAQRAIAGCGLDPSLLDGLVYNGMNIIRNKPIKKESKK